MAKPSKTFAIRAMLGVPFAAAVLCVLRGCLPGPVSSPSGWPRELKELVESAGPKGIDLGEIRVYRLYKAYGPLGVASEGYLWETKASPGFLDIITERWSLCPLESESERAVGLGSSLPPDWSSKYDAANVEFFIADNFNMGTAYEVMHDKTNETVVVEYRWDF